MTVSENPIVLTELEYSETDSYVFKYGEKLLPPDGLKQDLRVNIIFVNKKLTKVEFLDVDYSIDLKNVDLEKILIMDAVAKKVKEIEATLV
jgi:hypothetical protein